jgi:hypothetical protein
LRDTLFALGGAIPTRSFTPKVAKNSWEVLLIDVAEEKRSYEALLQPMQLAEQADPEIAEGSVAYARESSSTVKSSWTCS